MLSPVFTVFVFLMLMAALGVLVMWEFRRRPRGPRMMSQEVQSRLAGTPQVPYAAPPEPRTRSMDRRRN